MGAQLEVEWNDKRVVRGLKMMGARAAGLSKVMRRLRIRLRADLLAYAKSEASPEGSWAPRAQSTMDRLLTRASSHTYVNRERRRRGMRGPLQEGPRVTRKVIEPLGKLPIGRPGARMGTTVIGSTLIAKSPVRDISVIQDSGGVAGKGSRIPARGYVFMSPGFLEYARQQLVDWVHEGWRRA